MPIISFDTLKFARTPRDANAPQDQAEGIAKAFADATGEQIATKTDVKELESRLKETELRLVASIADAKAETLKWMFGTIGFQTVIILGAVAALNHFGH